MVEKLVIGSRGSKLALWQAEFVQKKLHEKGLESTIAIVKTTGDRVQDRFLHEIGGKGLFIKELEQKLLEGEIDIAVHSLKDMPVHIPPELSLAAYLARHSPLDALVIHPSSKKAWPKRDMLKAEDLQKLGKLKIATGSLRRKSILAYTCPEVEVIPIRGNVDTRMQKLTESSWDALILAHAGMERLSLQNNALIYRLDPDWFIPSACQGTLVIETRADHPHFATFRSLTCFETERSSIIERLVLEKLEADCSTPIGVYLSSDQEGSLFFEDPEQKIYLRSRQFKREHTPEEIAASMVLDL